METLSSLGTTELILVAIAFFIFLSILSWFLKKIFKFVLLGFIALGIIFLMTGNDITGLFQPSLENIFEDTTIQELRAKHCKEGKEDKIKCECFVMPVYNDLLERKGGEQALSRLENDKREMVNEMLQSFRIRKGEVNQCLRQKGEAGKKFLGTIEKIIEKINN